MMDYLMLPIEEKIIFVWIQHLYFEFMEHKHCNGYISMINDTIVPMKIMVMHKEYKNIIEMCPKAVDDMKFINGNQYHMNLFI